MATTPSLDAVEAQRKEQFKLTCHYAAIGALVVSPILILLPPRTPMRTSILLGLMGIGANHLAWEYSGEGLMARAQRRVTDFGQGQMPSERAREIQAKLREEKQRRNMSDREKDITEKLGGDAPGSETIRLAMEQAKERAGSFAGETREEKEKTEQGMLEKLWMGGETEDWKAKRDLKEKEALEEGRGYGGLIMDQIWEVWNWGGKKVEEVKEKDEAVVKAKTEEKK